MELQGGFEVHVNTAGFWVCYKLSFVKLRNIWYLPILDCLHLFDRDLNQWSIFHKSVGWTEFLNMTPAVLQAPANDSLAQCPK